MSGASSIEWTDVTWNPVAGCSIASAGCTNCYAMRMAARLQAMGHPKYTGTTRKSGRRYVWTGQVNADTSALDDPKRWKKSRRIFVNSMSDMFHEDVPEEFIQRVWDTMRQCDWHQFQVLTKRPERLLSMMQAGRIDSLEHVWLGTSVENAAVVERVEVLSAVTAAVRFVSFEPLIGPVGNIDLSKIHWAIVGGESGPNARTIRQEWVEQIQRTCERDDVAFFFKQWGGTNKKKTGRELNGKIFDEYPSTLASAA